MSTKLNLLAIGTFLAAAVAGSGQSTVQFTATSYTAAESAGAVAVTVQRLNDTDTAVTVDYAAVDGTAANGFGSAVAVAGSSSQRTASRRRLWVRR